MPFNLDGFEAQQFEPRTARVSVPDLAQWFLEGETPEWEVRGLTAAEFYRAMEAFERQRVLVAAADISSEAVGAGAELAASLKRLLGVSKSAPPELAKRLEMLVFGSVEPKITLPLAVKLGENFPIEFALLTNKIVELTGRGADLAKPVAVSQLTQA